MPERPYDIRERTFLFGSEVWDLLEKIPTTVQGRTAVQQLSDSAASVGANVEEADGADSKKDKRKSLIVSRKETRESRFWLRMVYRKYNIHEAEPLIAEATELINILSTMIQRLS